MWGHTILTLVSIFCLTHDKNYKFWGFITYIDLLLHGFIGFINVIQPSIADYYVADEDSRRNLNKLHTTLQWLNHLLPLVLVNAEVYTQMCYGDLGLCFIVFGLILLLYEYLTGGKNLDFIDTVILFNAISHVMAASLHFCMWGVGTAAIAVANYAHHEIIVNGEKLDERELFAFGLAVFSVCMHECLKSGYGNCHHEFPQKNIFNSKSFLFWK